MTRAEHMRWCKQRALEYLPADPAQACTSMLSDLRKHPDTQYLGEVVAALAVFSMRDAREARRFIEGFAE